MSFKRPNVEHQNEGDRVSNLRQLQQNVLSTVSAPLGYA